MNLLLKTKNFAWRSLEFLKLVEFTKPQTFDVHYRILVKNNSQKQKKSQLIIPLPLQTDHQTLVKSPVFDFKPTSLLQDQKYENSYAVFNLSLDSQEEKTFEYHFKIKLSPAFLSLTQKFTFQDYQNLSKKIKEKYCTSNSYIDSTDSRIIDLAKKIKGNSEDVMNVVRKINIFVMNFLEYGNPILGLYSSKQALEQKKVDCGGYSTFFVALCNALGIPARVVSGFLTSAYIKKENRLSKRKDESTNPKNNFMPGELLMHAWAEFMLPNGQWIPVDPSTEFLFSQGRTRKSGHFGFMGSDHIIFSIGCDIPLDLSHAEKINTAILQNAFLYPESNDLETRILLSIEN